MKTCFECGAPADHEHHVVPRSLGGTQTVPLCGACHGKVHDLRMTDARELTRRALRKKMDGGWRAGNVPFGYQAVEDNGLREEPREQASIREVLRLRAAGLTFREIQARKIPGRRGPIGLKQVFKVVKDAGKLVVVRGF